MQEGTTHSYLVAMILSSRMLQDPPAFAAERATVRSNGKLNIDGIGITSVYKMEYDSRRSSNANDLPILGRTITMRWAKAFLLTKPILIMRQLLLELIPFQYQKKSFRYFWASYSIVYCFLLLSLPT